jgi:hypothetical protein
LIIYNNTSKSAKSGGIYESKSKKSKSKYSKSDHGQVDLPSGDYRYKNRHYNEFYSSLWDSQNQSTSNPKGGNTQDNISEPTSFEYHIVVANELPVKNKDLQKKEDKEIY